MATPLRQYGCCVSLAATLLILAASPTLAQDVIGDYRTNGDATFSSPTGWEKFDGTNWVPATAPPTSTDGAITIRHLANVTTAISLDQVVINSGGRLVLDAQLTIADGIGDDITIQSDGVLEHAGSPTNAVNPPNGTGRLVVQTGGIVRVTSNTSGQGDWYARIVNLAAPDQIGKYTTWQDGAIFDWDSTNGPVPVTNGVTYFPAVAEDVVPIFRVSVVIAVGGANPTVINGLLEANENVTWQGVGNKTFRNGLGGSAKIIQSSAPLVCGQFIVGNDDPLNAARLEGSGAISLNPAGVQVLARLVSVNTTASFVGKAFEANSFTSAVTMQGAVAQNLGAVILGQGIDFEIINNKPVTLIGIVSVLGGTIKFNEGCGNLVLDETGLAVSGNILRETNSGYIVTAGVGMVILTDLKNSDGPKTIPIGASAESFTPLTVANNNATAATFNCRALPAVYASGISGAAYDSPNQVLKRSWEISSTSTDANVSFDWQASDEVSGSDFQQKRQVTPANESNFSLYNSTGGAKLESLGRIPVTVNFSAQPYQTTFNSLNLNALQGVFTVGTADFTPLPVTFRSFSGRRQDGAALLNWATTAEVNNRGFEVERAPDATAFERVGFVSAAVAPRPVNFYSFTDREVAPAGSYYRLRQVDTDGRVAYSRVVFVSATEGFALYPNPSRGTVTVRFALPEAAQLWLITASGQPIWQTDDLPAAATAALNQRLATLPPGFYVLRVQQGIQTYQVRLVRQ